jgi:hypothetical protein
LRKILAKMALMNVSNNERGRPERRPRSCADEGSRVYRGAAGLGTHVTRAPALARHCSIVANSQASDPPSNCLQKRSFFGACPCAFAGAASPSESAMASSAPPVIIRRIESSYDPFPPDNNFRFPCRFPARRTLFDGPAGMASGRWHAHFALGKIAMAAADAGGYDRERRRRNVAVFASGVAT